MFVNNNSFKCTFAQKIPVHPQCDPISVTTAEKAKISAAIPVRLRTVSKSEPLRPVIKSQETKFLSLKCSMIYRQSKMQINVYECCNLYILLCLHHLFNCFVFSLFFIFVFFEHCFVPVHVLNIYNRPWK